MSGARLVVAAAAAFGVGFSLLVAGCSVGPEPEATSFETAVSTESSPAAGAEESERLRLSVSRDLSAGDTVASSDLAVTGGGEVSVDIVTAGGGELLASRGVAGRALRFPAFSSKRVAAIVSVSSSTPGWMDPGDRRLTFGVAVRLDAESSGTVADNGDNLLQRGLFDDPAQFKVQADHRQPSCLVRGDEGSVLVKSPVRMEPGAWYRLRCERDDQAVTIRVSLVQDGVVTTVRSTTATGRIGDVVFAETTPISIGGKLDPDGGAAAATDQLNGRLGRAFVEIAAATEGEV